MLRILALLCGIAITGAGAATAQDNLSLELPLDCALPDRCVVQFHVDRAPGNAVSDYRCGRLSYDIHRGTDFRVLQAEDFLAGVPVLAAADGVVVAIRDGMPDIDVDKIGRDKVAGRSGGNVVVIAHEGGWFTHYWHLRQGSVAVNKGQRVSAGTRLGLIGLSGDTNFPHLHFELRRGPDRPVDPFAPNIDASCGLPSAPLWSDRAMSAMPYHRIFANGGFAARKLGRQDAFYGQAGEYRPKAGTQALHFWFELAGLARNDRISVQWRLPDGTWRDPAGLVWQSDFPYDFNGAQLNLAPPIAPGTYAVRLRVERDGENAPLLDRIFEVSLD